MKESDLEKYFNKALPEKDIICPHCNFNNGTIDYHPKLLITDDAICDNCGKEYIIQSWNGEAKEKKYHLVNNIGDDNPDI